MVSGRGQGGEDKARAVGGALLINCVATPPWCCVVTSPRAARSGAMEAAGGGEV